MRLIIEVLASKRTLYSLIITWLVVIIFSNLVLPPVDDDKFYLAPAMGLLYKSQLGAYIGDDFVPIFGTLPGFFFFQGLFLGLMSFLHVQLNIYTYRLFLMVSILVLILLSLYLIFLIHRRRGNYHIMHSNIFMIVLGITPFSQYCWNLRPEILGIVFILAGLIFYRYWDLSQKGSNVLYYLSALFLGLSMTVHPNVTIYASFLVLVVMLLSFKKDHISRPFLFGCVSSVPLFIIAVWFLKHYPESLQELMFNINKKTTMSIGNTPFQMVVRDALMLTKGNPKMIKVFWAIFAFPLLALLLTTVIMFIKNGKEIIKKDRFNIIIISIFFLAVIRLFIPEGMTSHNYVKFTAFFTALALPIALVLPINRIFKMPAQVVANKKVNLYKTLIMFMFIGIIALHSIIHTIKFTFSSEQYYYAPKVHSAVTSQLESGDTLFLKKDGLVPTFIDLFEAKYKGNTEIKIYHTYSFSVVKSMKPFMKSKIQSLCHDKTVWGVYKNGLVFDRDNMRLSTKLYSIGGIAYMNMDFKIKKIIYEDKRSIFFRPSMIEYKEL